MSQNVKQNAVWFLFLGIQSHAVLNKINYILHDGYYFMSYFFLNQFWLRFFITQLSLFKTKLIKLQQVPVG